MISSFHFTTFQIALWLASNILATSKGDKALEFHREPASTMLNPKDEKAIFRCSTTPSSAKIEWLQNGEPIIEEPEGTFRIEPPQKLIVRLPKATNESGQSFQNAIIAPSDLYLQCLARYKGQAILSRPAKLIVGTLSSFRSKNNTYITVIKGNTALIPCKPPYSVPSVVTEFEFDGSKVDSKSGRYLFQPSGNLQILNAQLSDSGVYRCIAHNPFLEERKASKSLVHLNVIDKTEQVTVNFTHVPPPTTSVIMGSNVTLECAASGFPVPNITWHKRHGILPLERNQQIAGNLLLFSVRNGDEGTYICRAENGHGRTHSVETFLDVQEIPQIVKFKERRRAHEGASVSLECVTKGQPKPLIMWYHDGVKVEETARIAIKESKLVIHKLKHNDKGIYQCFASNELEATYAASHLAVISKEKKSHNTSSSHHHNRHKQKKIRKNKRVMTVPPSKPEVTRLSDDSVIVRWEVPDNDGLPISFFKVQYREVDKKIVPEGSWNTTDDDIASHIHSYPVTGLKRGAKYKFRIAAVYSNTDNKMSPESDKFSLRKDTPMKLPGQKPVITKAEAVSPSAIQLHWEYRDLDLIPITGFIIYYRSSHTAGDYVKVPVSGPNTRAHIVTHLLPETPYDLKMQSFNEAGTSEFSNIYTVKTKDAEIHPDQYGRTVKTPSEMNTGHQINYSSASSSTNNTNKLLYIVLGVALSIMVIVLIVFLVLFTRKKRKNNRRRGDLNDRAEIPRLAVNGHGIEGNGYIPRSRPKINISVNPLSEVDSNISGEAIYPLVLQYPEIPSNNNDVILLSTLERGRTRRNENGNANHEDESQAVHQAMVHESTA